MSGSPVPGIAPAFYRRPPGSAFFNRSEKTVVLPGAKYWTERLQDDAESRAEYFSRMLDAFGNVDLIFFDPDNGLEVKSRKYGHQHSSKYLDWRELIECCFGAGLSTLPS